VYQPPLIFPRRRQQWNLSHDQLSLADKRLALGIIGLVIDGMFSVPLLLAICSGSALIRLQLKPADVQ
jgi:hypothetical protein